ncbi:unnamed protein product, partial [Mesorhabditis spiculigera]
MVVLFGVVMGQMTFTDNWQKRAPARPQWSPLDDPCEPVTALDRLREIQKLQRQILLLADEATHCHDEYRSAAEYILTRWRDDSAKNRPRFVALGSISCYANLQGYAMQVLNLAEEPDLVPKCPQKDFMFRRHCALAEFLAASQYGWALFLDADIGVVNPLHRLENYTLTEDLHLVFYNRFYNDEVASGSYIVRNSQRGLGFLHFWANYYQEHPYFGTDNGAINNVIVEYFHPELYESRQVCEAIWAASKNYEGLFNYQACVQEYILSVAASTEYHIYEKGRAWVRDGWLTDNKWSLDDFFFHGWKRTKIGNEWNFRFTDQQIFSQPCRKPEDVARWRFVDGATLSDTDKWNCSAIFARLAEERKPRRRPANGNTR